MHQYEPQTVALKVDVDTYCGTRDGIPNLLQLLEAFGVRATFYFSLGPDNSGKAVRRLLHKGFLAKMLRTKAPAMYGLKTMLYGTLLPAPMIGKELGEVIRSVRDAGHETGIHCWDHVEWHDHLHRLSRQEVEADLGRAFAGFEEIFGSPAATCAAPGWTVSAASFEVQDSLGLAYCSDTRGEFPFYPVFNGKRFQTLQVPSTWPTMDELIGENGITAATVNDIYLRRLRSGLNVHTIHAELEGKALTHAFKDLLTRLTGRGVRFLTLREAATEYGAEAPDCSVEMAYLPGRAMPVALQRPAL
ncbi:4-deoxy-4-formamido-L-arabinose-phosphoundecaprenol deformylase [Geomonas nitrogeniifigens]|uniref:4-deoxy-4-formamido-L-arabinose-phosphoundecaprenol deformylase n=1 Tax=Geomonas diazotrophica TaxID=2843197 RepID=A0ABX8JQN5_9BACT|nr:polysaccharide deacetylase family protein [Geomonas nitrogeniifigens]QWV98937.1 4-deoxy-4-formamido-L-arabinose-phosphoundecaprenol deformylase [Geomonas nitrogeniifigens]QXE88085.1 4-deoxy-4-formamido-L-arabinose-phosphoundecaprenol deformylase [Geomonas nitrogeniifigens]